MFIKGNFLVLFAFPLKTLYPTANSVKSVALLVNFVALKGGKLKSEQIFL